MSAIYLASRSPRRRELLAQIGVNFELLRMREGKRHDLPTIEDRLAGESADDYVRRVACLKAQMALKCIGARHGFSPLPVLAADTTVALAGETLAKPVDAADAARMLRLLAGTRHRVLTAVAVAAPGNVRVRVSESSVYFGALDETRIDRYVASGEPFDKAGGYGIQGRAGAFVRRIEGSYTAVMGLPLFETAELLREFGVTVP